MVDAAGEHGSAPHLGDGPALTRDHRLVDVGGAFDDDAVHADALSRPDEHERAGDHLAHRAARLGAAVEHRHLLPVHGQHRGQVAHRPGAARGLEVAAERVQQQEHRRGVEIDFGRAGQDGQGGVGVGRPGAERDQGRRGQAAPGRRAARPPGRAASPGSACTASPAPTAGGGPAGGRSASDRSKVPE